MSKQCTKCGFTKEESLFGKDGLRSDGLMCWCKDCVHQQCKDYYSRNRTRLLHKIAARYIVKRELIGEYIKKYGKAYRKAHHDQIISYVAKRDRSLGFIELYPNPFDATEIVEHHHINDADFVYLPKDLHRLYCGRDSEVHRINLSYIVNQVYRGE